MAEPRMQLVQTKEDMMSASLYDRLLRYGGFNDDGGEIEPIRFFKPCLDAYEAGIMTAAQIKSALSLTTPQGNDLDAILATMPSISLLSNILDANQRARWAEKTASVFSLGNGNGLPGGNPIAMFDTPTKCKAALGIS